MDFGTGLYILCGVMAVVAIVKLLTKKQDMKKTVTTVGGCAALCLVYLIPAVANLFSMVQIPMVTFLLVGLLLVFLGLRKSKKNKKKTTQKRAER